MVAAAQFTTRLVAGIPVPNTALINSSIALARANLPDPALNHVMRAWLVGQAIINRLPSESRSKVDEEAFGIAAILHDIGLAFDTSFVTPTARFEVDGANIVRDFILSNASNKHDWDKHRLQLVWDAIALHNNDDFARFKEYEVAVVSGGIYTELAGIDIGKEIFGELITLNQFEYDAIAEAFPKQGLKGFVHESFIKLCKLKPKTTYSNFVSDWGEKYVEGYTKVGHRPIDLLESVLLE